MNRFLFQQMEQEWNLDVRDVPYPTMPRYVRMLTTFYPNKTEWKKRHGKAMTEYHLSAPCFRERSGLAQNIAQQHREQADIVFQIGGLFNGLSGAGSKPRMQFASFNTTLAYREWKPWAPFHNDADFQKWVDLERECYHQADCIVCTNRYAMRSFVADYGIPEEKLHYIGYGINFDKLPQVTKTYSNRLALFVGYDFVRKGGPTVVEAFRQARQHVPDARLRIVGPSHLDEQYLGEGIEFVPRLSDRSAVVAHFAEADFFVMPSVCEPFGLVFLEAMACGNACIGSFRNAMPEIIEEGKTGFLIEPGDSDQLAAYMRAMFKEPDLTQSMGEASYERVQSQFTWPVCGSRVRDALRTLKRTA